MKEERKALADGRGRCGNDGWLEVKVGRGRPHSAVSPVFLVSCHLKSRLSPPDYIMPSRTLRNIPPNVTAPFNKLPFSERLLDSPEASGRQVIYEFRCQTCKVRVKQVNAK